MTRSTPQLAPAAIGHICFTAVAMVGHTEVSWTCFAPGYPGTAIAPAAEREQGPGGNVACAGKQAGRHNKGSPEPHRAHSRWLEPAEGALGFHTLPKGPLTISIVSDSMCFTQLDGLELKGLSTVRVNRPRDDELSWLSPGWEVVRWARKRVSPGKCQL